MATQTIDLGITGAAFQSNGIWQGAILLDSAFIDGGGTAYLRVIQPVGNSIRVQLSETDSGVPTDAGPEFTSSFESSNVALTLEDSASNSVTIGGPNTGTFPDPSEPYFWTPTNGPALNTWFNGTLTGTIQVTLNDGIVGTSQTPIALSGSAAGTHTATLRVEVAAGHTHIGVVPTYENEFGRFVIMVGEDAKWYSDIQNSDSSFETIGTLESGSKVVWSTGDGSIGNRLAMDRIWWVDRSDSFVRDLRLNRSQLGQSYANQSNFNTYLTANPDTYIHFGTDHGTVSLPWSDRRSIGPHYINITPTADQIAILDQVAVGELVNVVISDGNTLAAAPVTPTEIALSGSAAGAHTASLRVEAVAVVPTAIALSGSALGTHSAALSVVANAVPRTPIALSGSAAGTHTASLRVEVQAQVPAQPSAPTLVVDSDVAITASWTAPDDGGEAITSYDIRYRRTGTTPWTSILFETGTTRQITGLSATTEYEVQVRATNSVGNGSWSASATATTSAPISVPDAPACPSAVVDGTSVEISWGLSITIASADSGLVAHEAEADPHPVYSTDADLTAHEATTHGGAAAVASHEAEANPHSIYATDSDLTTHAATVHGGAAAVASHEGESDPHPTYATDANLTAHEATPHGDPDEISIRDAMWIVNLSRAIF